MKAEQWVNEVSKAYRSFGLNFTEETRTSLLSENSEGNDETQKSNLEEALEVMTRLFCRKASTGGTFGSIGRIAKKFGRTLEMNYGLSSGPFFNMAKTYWTFKVEVGDLFPDYYNLGISQILGELEMSFASLFFPTARVAPVDQYREHQRRFLRKNMPSIDSDRFLAENPLLKAAGGGSGCLGAISVFILFPMVLFLFLAH